jgi:hypothetical protein
MAVISQKPLIICDLFGYPTMHYSTLLAPQTRPYRKFLSTAAFLTVFLLNQWASPAFAEDSFSFLTLSDVPYTDEENVALTQTLVPAIQESKAPFVIHMGDLKNSKIPCSEELLTRRRNQIFSLHLGRVFYTPGDNDWTDCDRKQISVRFSELNRLDLLRRLFYNEPHLLPNSWAYERQALYPENMRWKYESVVFATVHLVSTNNGRREILLDDIDLALTRVDARDRANIIWLEHAFMTARKTNASAIVIATQADVTNFKYTGKCTFTRRRQCDAFASFKTRLKELASAYKKPVLLMHGDTNPYCLDREFGGRVAPNLWRFNSTGDYSFVDAVKVDVNPDSPDEPFTFISLVEKRTPAGNC